ncbi:hypothetical protein SLS53_009286 [Cytospora paraplurivora]|uniref:Mid2 domain-containing protein n=1 Tax=Cytospora paraplurivora TaxID=2898453 RepID=A0AAN9YBX8_9PEZI
MQITALIKTNIGSLLTSATTTSTTGAATVTVTSTSTTSAEVTPSSSGTAAAVADCPKDNTAVVGGAVGGALGAALLASVGALAFMIKRRKVGMAPEIAPANTQSGPAEYKPYPERFQSPGGTYVLPTGAISAHEMQS